MSQPVILYVEDEDSDVLLLRLAMELGGVEVVLESVEDGNKAVDYLSGHEPFRDRARYPLPSLVLVDVNLPRGSGFHVLQWIRQQPQFASLPVIIYTSSLNTEDNAKARRLGANDYVVKLSDVYDMAKFVRDLTQRWFPDLAPGRR